MKVEISKKQNKKAPFSVYLQKVVVLRVEKKHHRVQDNVKEVIVLGNIADYSDMDDGVDSPRRYVRWGSKRVLLREPEKCLMCSRDYLSLYPVKSCSDHIGLEEL